MKRSTFLFVLVTALAVPVYLIHRSRNAFDDVSLATSIETNNEVKQIPSPLEKKETTTAQGSIAQKPEEQDDFDVENRKKAVMALVDRGIAFVKKTPFDIGMSVITHGRELVDGELYLFVYDMKGICIAHGQSPELIWKDCYKLRDPFGTYIIQESIKAAQAGGGWVTYQWRNATKVSYIKPFSKDGKDFLMGTGYYAHSKPDSVIKLVKGAVNYFKGLVLGKGDQAQLDAAFSLLSYPIGRFLQGDLFLYAIDFNGNMMANGERPGLIGTNVLNDKDEAGSMYNQEIIKRLANTPAGIWVEYRSRNTTKKVYAEKIRDRKGTEYFIACGYYPHADRNALFDLVRKGYDFLKKHGVSTAAKEFSDRAKNTFRFGDLYLFVYDLKGVCIAHGGNPDYVGLNQNNLQDDDGRYYIKEIIEKAQHGGGWTDFKLRNAFQSLYVEKVDLGLESYVIGSGVYPLSRRETTLLLTHSAANFLRTKPSNEVFAHLGNSNGTFVRGDLNVFVLDFQGIARIYGDNYDVIWRNLLDVKDDDGKEYVKIFINTVKAGPGQVSYTINGVRRIAFVEMVEKNGTSYVVGSGYFV